MFHRVQTFPRAQILQEFDLRCQSLAANNKRGFKQEFEVSRERGTWSGNRFVKCLSCMSMSLGVCRSSAMLAKISPPESGTQRSTDKRIDTPTFYRVRTILTVLQGVTIHVATFETFVCFSTSACRWSLSRQALHSKLLCTQRLHQCKFCACKISFESSNLIHFILATTVCICY